MPGPVGIEPHVGPSSAGGNSGESFVSVWDTSVVTAGSTAAGTVKLPLEATGTYDFVIHWGDGTWDRITAYDTPAATHIYAAGGLYTVTITGTIKGWQFNNTGDRGKLTDIQHWGCLQLGNNGSQFYGCYNLQISATDAPNLIGTTSFYQLFRGCTQLTGDFSNWDVSGVTSLNNAFYGCSSFDGDLSAWDTGNVVGIAKAFYGCLAFNRDITIQPPRCANLTSDTQYAEGANIGDGASVTVGFRMKTTAAGTQYILTKGTGAGSFYQWFIRSFDQDTLLLFQLQGSGAAFRQLSIASLDLTQWTDVVVTMVPGGIYAMVNGVEYSNTTAGTGTWNTSGGVLRIGQRAASTGGFVGQIRDVVIAEADLWTARATLLDSPETQPAVLAHYPMEEGAGRRAFNRLSNAYHMTWSAGTDTNSLHAVDRQLTQSFANANGYSKGRRFVAAGTGVGYDSSNTWISKDPVPGDFQVDFYVEANAAGSVFGVQLETTPQSYTGIDFGMRLVSNQLQCWENGVQTATGAAVVAGDRLSIVRKGSTVTALVNGVPKRTYTATTTADLYGVVGFDVADTPALTLASYGAQSIRTGSQGSGIASRAVVIPRLGTAGATGRRLTAITFSTSYASASSWLAANPVRGNFRVDWRYEAVGAGGLFGLQDSTTVPATLTYNAYDFGFQYVDASSIRVWQSGVNSTVAATVTADSIVSLVRAGTTVYLQVDGVIVHTYTTTSGAALYAGASISYSATPGSMPVAVLDYYDGQQIQESHVGSNVSSQAVAAENASPRDAIGSPLLYASHEDTPKFDTPNVTNLASMFHGCTSFDGDVGGWDTRKVTTFSSTFHGCSSFNRDVSAWQPNAAADLSSMFEGAAEFNQPVRNLSNFTVVNTARMFYGATRFNQHFGGAPFSGLQVCDRMFYGASAFSQYLAFAFEDVTSMVEFLTDSGCTTAHYDSLLQSLASVASLENIYNVTLGVGLIKYTAGGFVEGARNTLINTYGWTITDGGPA